MNDETSPIELEFYKAGEAKTDRGQSLVNFSSYSFDRNMLVPASPFRFTAEGVDYTKILQIRSGDTVELWAKNARGEKIQLATGFLDETDSHTSGTVDEYVLTGRDTLGQLIDNAAIDAENKIIHLSQISLEKLALKLIENTRMVQQVKNYACPTGPLLFRTNPGETKINALQRYLEYTNCLVWSEPNGTMAIGKPNMASGSLGTLSIMRTDPSQNNVLDIRVRRNLSNAIRQIAVQLQTQNLTDPTNITNKNADDDMKEVYKYGVGKSVYRAFSLGNGEDAVNLLVQVGAGGTPQQIGYALSRRELAMSNLHVLEVECTVQGHINDSGIPYNVNQVYRVRYEKEQIFDDMFCYACRYDLTKDYGRTTTLKLCRLGAIVADVPIVGK